MKTTNFLPLAIFIAISLSFFACSSDDGGGNQDDENSSSSVIDGGESSSSVNSSNGNSSSSTSSSSNSSGYSGSYGSVEDDDGNNYKTVVIGTQTWMAENLNYATESGSVCNGNDDANCTKYGRLYNWATAMNLGASCNNNSSCSDDIEEKHQGICPSDWHIPNNEDWDLLYHFINNTDETSSSYAANNTVGRHLKATSGWNNCGPSGSGNSNLCEDTYGFAALPGGYGTSASNFGYAGERGYWLNASESSATGIKPLYITYNNEYAYYDTRAKNYFYSVRCVKD